MAIKVEHLGDVAVVILKGTFISGRETDELDAVLTQVIAKEARTLVNLDQVRHLSSIAIGVFAKAAVGATRRNGHFVLCGTEQSISSIFSMLTTPLPFRHYSSCGEALEALQEM